LKIKFLFLLFLIISCSPSADYDSNILEIKKVNQKYLEFYNSGNYESVTSLHTEDAVVMPPNVPARIGKDQIMSAIKEEVDMGFTDLKFIENDIKIFGNLAYDEGSYSLNVKSEKGEVIDNDSGKYLVVWEKQNDGRWLMKKDIWNSDLPTKN
tara:strand:+ start:181 stop:639 length:459 start_codon:yes stop_codon:yes gene_type:complete